MLTARPLQISAALASLAALVALAPATHAGAPASPPEPVTLLDDPERHWFPFGLELAYIDQRQDYEISAFDHDFRPPRIVAPKIKDKDVAHLVPATLPPAIRGPLITQARKEAQKIADQQAAAARASIPTVDESLIEGIENHAETVTLKADYSPFPFLSVYAIGGHLDGYVDVDLADGFDDLTVDYEGWLYGGGATLSAAVGSVFASLTAIYTHADLDGGDAEIDTLIVSPKIGIHGPRGALYTGAHYQDTTHRQSGTITVEPLGDIGFDIELEDAENWSWIVGGRLNLTERLFLSAEGGFGERTHGLASIGIRF